ncbi:hypothetical protein ACHAXT_006143 [Thalassiosira profunda]
MTWEDIVEMPTHGLREELLCLLGKELEYSLPPAGLDHELPSPSKEQGLQSPGQLRRDICEWAYECVDYFNLDREIVYVSMRYFDRYLARQASPPSTVLGRLLGLSCLYVACKLYGSATESPSSPSSATSSIKLRLQDFCNMSCGQYCEQMIAEMELSLLSNLEWKLHPPTPTDFLVRFVKILSLLLNDGGRHADNGVDSIGKGWSVFEVARYQIELGTYSSDLCHNFPASKIALAALLNAMDSKIVRTQRAIVSPRIRRSFLEHLIYLGGGFAGLDLEGEDMVHARSILKELCSKTIVLPGQVAEELEPPAELAFVPISEQPSSFEYELSDVKSASGASTSPVSVAADHF